MTGRFRKEPGEKSFLVRRWPELATATVLVLLLITGLFYYDIVYPVELGPRQPIPFSHRVHVQFKNISCFMCHTEAIRSARAGIPPLETCMLCHARIIRTHPYIAEVRRHYAQNRPVIWERVNWVAEFVYFNHAMHVVRGFDCGICHGEVAQMDRVIKAREFQMGFCVQCHRNFKGSTDCYICHR